MDCWWNDETLGFLHENTACLAVARSLHLFIYSVHTRISSSEWSVLRRHTVKHPFLKIWNPLPQGKIVGLSYMSPQLFCLRMDVFQFLGWVSMTSEVRPQRKLDDKWIYASWSKWISQTEAGGHASFRPPEAGEMGEEVLRAEKRGVVMGTDMESPVWVKRLETKWQNSEAIGHGRGCTIAQL